MNDQERQFDNLIKKMEREVRDLKTAHQRPLGALDFYLDTLSFDVNIQSGAYGVSFYVDVQLKEPTAKPPIAQIGYNIPNGFYDVSVMSRSVDAKYTTWTYRLMLSNNGSAQTVNIRVGAISAQPILGISWRY